MKLTLDPAGLIKKGRRDYFVAAALPGVIVSLNRNQLIQAANLEAARGAIRVADAVIAELEADDEDVSNL